MTATLPLPIDDLRTDLESAWAKAQSFILRSPTGSGKSTRVPRFLLEWNGFHSNDVIIVLQPRRMAARLLAKRVAAEFGQPLGQTVGYQIRFDSVRSEATRILYVTEGLLLRWLIQGDVIRSDGVWHVPGLGSVGAILFDEFHERHLEGDIGLGLATKLQKSGWRGKIGVFSATLETKGLLELLPEATVLESEGRQYPVQIDYLGHVGSESLWDRAVRGVQKAIHFGAAGDILIFQPGKYEILRTVEGVSHLRETKGWDVYPLHGELDAKQQDLAVSTGDRPRIIVSTNIAETSLTLPGIRTVIDVGMVKLPGYDARRGVNTLFTEPISRASADQRAGRAGRVGEGRCFRLWSQKEHEHKAAFTPPEIERLDLSETRLQLMLALNSDRQLEEFPWVQKPDSLAWDRAERLLFELGAVDASGKLTAIGRDMGQFPLHPRLSRMAIAAAEFGCLDLVLAAIATQEGRRLELPLNDKRREREREDWWREAEGKSDLLKRVLIWRRVASEKGDYNYCRDWGIHWMSLQQAVKVYAQLKRVFERLEGHSKVRAEAQSAEEAFARAILFGYSDQLGRRLDRGTLRCELVHKRRGEMTRSTVVSNAELFVVTELEEREVRGEVTLLLDGITAVKEEWLNQAFPEEFRRDLRCRLDKNLRRVEQVEQIIFRDLVIREKELEGTPVGAEKLLADGILSEGWTLKQWNADVENWIRRLNVLAAYCPELEIDPIKEEDRRLIIEQLCEGATRYKDVKDREIMPILQSWLPDNLLPLMEEWVPVRFVLPTGSRTKLRYEDDGTVIISARIQQMYDVPASRLTICQGKCKLRVELLAPNGRPVQITEDLDGFWNNQYHQIRKDLFGRYPKHEWR